MTIPNWLTLSRILMIPVCIFFYYLPFQWSYWGASSVFILAAVTDWLDGYLARKLNQTTPFGAFIDPVADKLIVMAALVMLVEEHNTLWMTLPAIIMVGREIVISALREWMAELGKRASVAVNMIGKYKTTFQMIAIAVLLSQPPGTLLTNIGLIVLQVAAVLTIWSMFVYLKAAWPDLKISKNGR
ncbi:CDP-diacylglycerol--glycerol-3-phosphate 3-phosphatidyltransferase [Gynuella sunshinyii]|uniref:CDP-diacylglycerol--glycerol-3-phosphate 3-phosphatidyltransferase n=1 Tax=Gynuella sunshinyii YC6258 TaxID=1445510 RepID=A0A0C5VNE4_9GAMM|nr:CDP-diacylglycerol--glycerol-3-phosphate 3-phosphatidyltransferase [Gynuella sunshinyii]AJQ95821.1 phosphatidylglycerophosphate synthase [Gynuella sunshinyii YC6258]